MSNEVINDLSGLEVGFPFETETTIPAAIIKAYSGKQVAMSLVDHDFKRFGLTMPVRTRVNETTFMDFYNNHKGQLETFLFLDPKRKFVSRVSFGTGDGVETDFQLKNKDGFARTEIQEAPIDAKIWQNSVLKIKVADYNITYYNSGICSFNVAPTVGHDLECELYFWRRVRFVTAPSSTIEVGNNNIMLSFELEEVLP